jgi:sulfite dehydrogenase (cytochrome) subunit B
MRKRLLFLASAFCLSIGAAVFAVDVTFADSNPSGAVTITLPAPNNAFKPGPNVALAQSKCVICHSADYVYTQPPLTKKQWTAEVTKMQKTYGAPISDDDVGLLVDYLMSQNGKAD